MIGQNVGKQRKTEATNKSNIKKTKEERKRTDMQRKPYQVV